MTCFVICKPIKTEMILSWSNLFIVYFEQKFKTNIKHCNIFSVKAIIGIIVFRLIGYYLNGHHSVYLTDERVRLTADIGIGEVLHWLVAKRGITLATMIHPIHDAPMPSCTNIV